MGRRDSENLLVVTLTVALAISGVAALRALVGLDYHHWCAAYLAMGLTASIRRTSDGIDCTMWSALRGVASLLAGLCACQSMGYTVGSFWPSAWLPEEVVMAIARLR
jgi:hypothetical protein